ncbi:MAG: hypothetical protein KGS72_11660 [Cyanobacteria bacterium REEB67]|nr:hypothetical protein [Cyanobacteria bacterium REEB67]
MSLCTTCSSKHTLSVPGQCQKCSGLTSHFAHALCDACSVLLDECEWCRVPLSAGAASSISSKTGIAFITCRHVDAGKTFKNLRIGEEIHIFLNEDQYKWREWNVKRPLPSNFKLKSRGTFVPDPGNPQFGQREFVFEILSAGQNDIEFEEVQRTWSWFAGQSSSIGQAVQGGQSWKATFDIK